MSLVTRQVPVGLAHALKDAIVSEIIRLAAQRLRGNIRRTEALLGWADRLMRLYRSAGHRVCALSR